MNRARLLLVTLIVFIPLRAAAAEPRSLKLGDLAVQLHDRARSAADRGQPAGDRPG